MGVLTFIIFALIAVLVHMSQKRKELERRVETLEKIHGIEYSGLGKDIEPPDNQE